MGVRQSEEYLLCAVSPCAQTLDSTQLSQSCLQASILQEELRFCAAVKNSSCSRVVDTEEETTTGSLEDVPAPATAQPLKKRGKKR